MARTARSGPVEPQIAPFLSLWALSHAGGRPLRRPPLAAANLWRLAITSSSSLRSRRNCANIFGKSMFILDCLPCAVSSRAMLCASKLHGAQHNPPHGTKLAVMFACVRDECVLGLVFLLPGHMDQVIEACEVRVLINNRLCLLVLQFHEFMVHSGEIAY